MAAAMVECTCQDLIRKSLDLGEWATEPDRLEFEHAGMLCILHRGTMGAWCGYVGVAPGHDAHGKGYDDVAADVHGGLTYASESAGCVCHSKEPERLWWLGFDCAHCFDFVPGYSRYVMDGCEYRNIEYARRETESLAEQLASMK